MADAEPFHLRIEGRCPICERDTVFEAHGPWLRGTLVCKTCPGGSVPRERAVALGLNEARPNWRTLAIHESSPAERGISRKMKSECSQYTPSHFFADAPRGSMVGAFRNEDLEQQSFASATFDIVVTIDVFEHLFDPRTALNEIHRTLRPGGVMISAFPMKKGQAASASWRAKRNPDGSIQHLLPEQYHGNPISAEGSLVTVDYGYDVHLLFAEWAPFDVRVMRFADRRAGILGEFTDVVVCEKRGD